MSKNIKIAISAIIAALVVGAVDLLLQSFGITIQNTEMGSLQGFAIGAAINLVLVAFIFMKHNWAKWTFIILTVAGSLLYLPTIGNELSADMLGAISSIIQISLNIVAVILLLTPESSNWLKKTVPTS